MDSPSARLVKIDLGLELSKQTIKGIPMSLTRLSEAIAKRTLTSPLSCPAHINRAQFLLLRSDVSCALDDGWSVLAIYKALREERKIEFSYQAFRRYVRSLIRDQQTSHLDDKTTS